MTVKRVTFLQELLAFMGLGGRLHLAWISSAEAEKFTRVVADFTEQLRALGPNPLKAPDMNPLMGERWTGEAGETAKQGGSS